MGQFDQHLKWMTSQEPAGFLRWLTGLLPLGATVTLVDATIPTEIVSTARYADLVLLVEVDGERFLLHLDFQYRQAEEPGKDMGERVTGYGWRLYEREHLPVESVVLLLKPARKVPRPPFVIKRGGQEQLRYNYSVIRLS
jgi:hypothetical protein